MNKLLMTIVTLVLFSTAFAGCTKKEDGGGTVDAGSLDENAVYDDVLADTGYQVSGGLSESGAALSSGSNGSAASARVVDNAMQDGESATDKAEFLVDVRAADGSRVQAMLKSMATGDDVNLDTDLLGGAGNNVQVFGTTGLGPAEFPETKAYIALFGLSRVKIGDSTLERSHFTQVFVTRGIRDSSGALSTSIDANDLELHVILGSTASGNATGGPAALPDVADGYLYYYFENVKLKQLSPDQKSAVGSKLSPPEKANVPPVVVARVILPNGTAATSGRLEGPTPGNLTVFLDASLSQDSDGTIEAYSWDIRETNSTGALVPAGNKSKPSGANVSFTFSVGGLKAIGLRIIDNDGGIANTTQYFFLDYRLKMSYDFSSQDAGAIGAGPGLNEETSCIIPNNCNEHPVTVAYGAQKLSVTTPTAKSGTCNTPHIEIFDPADVKQSGTELDASKLAGKVGKWKVRVWYTAQASCVYEGATDVTYTPIAAAA